MSFCIASLDTHIDTLNVIFKCTNFCGFQNLDIRHILRSTMHIFYNFEAFYIVKYSVSDVVCTTGNGKKCGCLDFRQSYVAELQYFLLPESSLMPFYQCNRLHKRLACHFLSINFMRICNLSAVCYVFKHP